MLIQNISDLGANVDHIYTNLLEAKELEDGASVGLLTIVLTILLLLVLIKINNIELSFILLPGFLLVLAFIFPFRHPQFPTYLTWPTMCLRFQLLVCH